MARDPWKVRSVENYQVFDGRRFIPYFYTKPVALEMATKIARMSGKETQVWRKGSSGLALDVTVNV